MAAEETYKTLDLALRVGEVLLSSGAGASDVSAQMLNVAHACGLRGATADVTFTELAMSYQISHDEPAMIQIRQVRHRELDYDDLTSVDHVVRALIEGEITRDEARSQLAKIVSTGHPRPRWTVTVGNGVMGAGVGLMLGGSAVVTAAAFASAMVIDRIQRSMSRRRWPIFYQQVAGGLVATLVAVMVSAMGSDVAPSRIVTAAIIMLLAGVSFMGALQDALTGFPLTACARMLEAFLATAGVIGGVSGGLTIAKLAGVGFTDIDAGSAAYSPLPLMVLGGGITAGAFAFAAYSPLRALLPISLVGAMSTGIYALMYANGIGISWSSGAAAIAVGVVSFGIARRFRVPALIIVVSTVVPMLPGLSIYRGMSQLAQGMSSHGLLSLMNAAAVAVALSAGAIFGEYLAQPVAREARRLERRLSGPRLVGPLTARPKKKTQPPVESPPTTPES